MKAISQEAKSAIIEALKENSLSMINYGEIKNAVTLDKAIEIVESFPTEEPKTISKSAIIDALKKEKIERFDVRLYDKGIDKAIEIVESFPTSDDGGKQDSSNGWIPVTERLPERMQEVFAFSSKTGIRGIAFEAGGSWYFDDGNDTIFSDVTHWQPIPTSPVTK